MCSKYAKHNSAESCNAPLLSGGEEHGSSILLCFPFSLYFSFITMHVSSHVSLGSLCTFFLCFLLSPLSTFLLFPFLSLSSTLCSFHSLYYISLF